MSETARRRLPNRREHEVLEFDHGGFPYIAGIGRFANGGLAEIFLNVAKSGTTIEAQAQDAAILASLCLQHGATAEVLRHAVKRHANGESATAIGAVLDVLARQS